MNEIFSLKYHLMKYTKERKKMFFKQVWYSEKFQYVNLTEVDIFLPNRILILLRNLSHLDSKWDLDIPLVIVIRPEVSTQADKQEGLFSIPTYLPSVSVSLAHHRQRYIEPLHWQSYNHMGNQHWDKANIRQSQAERRMVISLRSRSYCP